MRVLFVATVRSHIGQFHMPFIRLLKSRGNTVDAAFKDNSDNKPGLDLSGIDNIYEIPFSRSPYSFDNIKAYKELKNIIDKGDYDIIHCHTPMGGVITRLAAISARKKGTKVIYTAHGFHFYNGAPLKNWLFYYPVEKILAKYTDCLITINSEDYKFAIHKLSLCKKIVHIPGVGIDINQFNFITKDDKYALRKKNCYNESQFLMIYPADFSFRKNQYMLFEMLKLLIDKYPDIKLILPGALENSEEFITYCHDNGLKDYVDFLGYRRDIFELDAMCDISVSSSRQEGLPINLIEAMALGNPIVATDVRGNNDLVDNGVNGYLVCLNDYKTMAEKVSYFIDNKSKIIEFGVKAKQMAAKYSVDNINEQLMKLYYSMS